MKVLFTEQAIGDVYRFIRYFEEAYFELYSDTGLHDERMIRDLFVNTAQSLKEAVLSGIVKRLSPDKILARKDTAVAHELAFHVRTRLVMVRYSEDKKRGIRIVESIAIDRKPIIF